MEGREGQPAAQPNPPPRLYHVYCDESSQNGARFMVLGGLIAEGGYESVICDTMKKYRQLHRMAAELKWGKVSNEKISEYRAFIDYFFALNNTDKLHFHAVIVDSSQIDHRAYSHGDKEDGFYKFYYQLLLHCFGHKYCWVDNKAVFQVRLDHRPTAYPLAQLRTILNSGMKKRYQVKSTPFLSVEPRDSKKTELIQITDLLLGAIGFQKNGYNLLAGAKQAKIDLAQYIAQKAGHATLTDNTPMRNHRFTIWNFKMGPRGGKKENAPPA